MPNNASLVPAPHKKPHPKKTVPTPTKSKSKPTNTVAIICVVLLLLAVIGAASFFFIRRLRPEAIAAASSSTTTLNTTAEDDQASFAPLESQPTSSFPSDQPAQTEAAIGLPATNVQPTVELQPFKATQKRQRAATSSMIFDEDV